MKIIDRVLQARDAFVSMVVILLIILPHIRQARAGTVMDYWLTAGDQKTIFVIHGNSVVNTITTPAAEYPLAIGDTVRTYQAAPNTYFAGREYMPDGTPTGVSYPNPGDFSAVWDGTTDGVSYNYALQQGSNAVIRYDRNWMNGAILFDDPTLGGLDWGGITYDSSNGSLWINNRYTNEFRNYALDGSLLASFVLPTTYNVEWGLAYESVTDSLWVFGGRGILNLSKDGTVLQQVLIPDFTAGFFNILGGEMRISTVPLPGSMWLFSAGMLALLGGIPKSRHRGGGHIVRWFVVKE